MRRLVLFLVFCLGVQNSFAQSNSNVIIQYEFAPNEISLLVRAAIDKADQALSNILLDLNEPRTFENTILPLENLMAELNDRHLHIALLKDVLTDLGLIVEAYRADRAIREFKIRLMLNADLYRLFEAARMNSSKEKGGSLDREDGRLIDVWTLKFKKSGAWLLEPKRSQLLEFRLELLELSEEFMHNLNECTDVIYVTSQELSGLDAAFKKEIESRVMTPEGLYPISTQWKDFSRFMAKATSQDACRRMYEARNNRALQNLAILQRGLVLKQNIANLLQYDSWVDYKTDGNMMGNAAQIRWFMDTMREKLATRYKEEQRRLASIKGAPQIEPWEDLALENRLIDEVFAIDPEKLREYFPADGVSERLLHKFSTRYNVEFRKLPMVSTLDPSIQFYDVIDTQTQQSLGTFFVDLFSRDHKFRDASAPEVVKGRRLPGGQYQKPVTGVLINVPHLMSLDDIQTLAHETHHALHELCSKSRYASFSGFLTEPDAAEIPSQVGEFVILNAETLQQISGHYQTGEKLSLLDSQRMIDAQRLLRVTNEMRELFQMELDYELHTRKGSLNIAAIYQEVYERVMGRKDPLGKNFSASFSFLMDPMYEGNYSIYRISLAMAKDVMRQNAIDEQRGGEEFAGMRFRKEVLEKGGSMSAKEIYRRYLGREFSMDAYFDDLTQEPKDSLMKAAERLNALFIDEKEVRGMSDTELRLMSQIFAQRFVSEWRGESAEKSVSSAFDEVASQSGWSEELKTEISSHRFFERLSSFELRKCTVDRVGRLVMRELKRVSEER